MNRKTKLIKKPSVGAHESNTNETMKATRKKKERQLDKTIEDTFPASDATAQY